MKVGGPPEVFTIRGPIFSWFRFFFTPFSAHRADGGRYSFFFKSVNCIFEKLLRAGVDRTDVPRLFKLPYVF